jgi:hypothetical protein
MRVSKRSSLLVLPLLIGSICCPGARASADETLSLTIETPATETQATDQPETVAGLMTIAPASLPDSALPDDPAAGVQPQAQEGSTPAAAKTTPQTDPLAQGRQTKRILYIVPNFRAVSADQHLPPQTVKEKFKTAMLDSVDYSSFIFVGVQAGVAMATNSYPEFRQGAKGYGRYYWHTLADTINENTWVEFIVPAALHQDTRYYTLGKGAFVKRVGYAFSRVAITRTDSGHEAINYSEIVGAGAASGTANLYYPSQERTFTKTYQRWITYLAIDGGVFVFKEVWPDINNAIFHQKDKD